jgi:UV DNA damage endonuclease
MEIKMYNLCCISNELKQEGHSFKTMTWKRFNQLCDKYGDQGALAELGDRWLNNVQMTYRCIQHCYDNGWGYRVSSSLFPILTHPDFHYNINDVPQYAEIMWELDSIAIENKNWGVRLSTHPSQFVVLASENQSAVEKSIVDLNHHGWVMDKLGCNRDYSSPINIHVNCTKGDLSDIADRFMSNLSRCDHSVTSRLVVENEDKGCWTVDNLINHFYKDNLIPITFDNLHFKCNPSQFDEGQAMALCAATWGMTKPLFHYSESHPDKTNPRSHADMPTDCPPDFHADFDIELKGKCYAIRRCEEIRNARLSSNCPLPTGVEG